MYPASQAPQVELLEAWGNARAQAYYEANVPGDYRQPPEGAGARELQRWIRDKVRVRMRAHVCVRVYVRTYLCPHLRSEGVFA